MTAQLTPQPPAVKPLRRDAAQNRERLLTAAMAVFAEHGLEAGVEEVAKAAGVGMGTLYRRFPSKQALIDELVADLRRELLEIAQLAGEQTDGSGLEQLLFATGSLQTAQRGCLTRLWTQSEGAVETIEQFRAILDVLLERAQQHGLVRPEITAADISMILWSVSDMIETTAAYAPKGWRRHLEIMIAGIRPVGVVTDLREVPLTLTQLRRARSAVR